MATQINSVAAVRKVYISPMAVSESIKKLSDSQLYTKCKEYGLNARLWMRKFAALLPEVYKRQLFKKRGFISIHEFAAKLAGMSYSTTDKILNLAARLENKPLLKELFYSGSQGWSKLETVAYIATAETDKFWTEKIKIMSKQALMTYVCELRKTEANKINTLKNARIWQPADVRIGENNRLDFTAGGDSQHIQPILQTGGGGPDNNAFNINWFANGSATEDGNKIPFPRLSFPLPPELEFELKLFKQKLEKQRKQTLGWAEVMEELLKGYHAEDGDWQKKQLMVTLCEACIKNKITGRMMGQTAGLKIGQTIGLARQGSTGQNAQINTPNRCIPSSVKKLVLARAKNRCVFPLCNKPPDIFHHTRRFALYPDHNPDFIIPLCKIHERIVHSGLIENEEKSPVLWKLRTEIIRGEMGIKNEIWNTENKTQPSDRTPTDGAERHKTVIYGTAAKLNIDKLVAKYRCEAREPVVIKGP